MCQTFLCRFWWFWSKATRTKEIFIILVRGDVVRRKPLRKFSLRGDGKKAHEWPVARKNAFQKRETGPRKQCAQCTENKIEASRMGVSEGIIERPMLGGEGLWAWRGCLLQKKEWKHRSDLQGLCSSINS